MSCYDTGYLKCNRSVSLSDVSSSDDSGSGGEGMRVCDDVLVVVMAIAVLLMMLVM